MAQHRRQFSKCTTAPSLSSECKSEDLYYSGTESELENMLEYRHSDAHLETARRTRESIHSSNSLPHAKCILARFNAIRIRAKSYSEGPRAGWAAVLDLPVQNDFTCVPPDHARTTSFEIQGIIRLRPADPAQCPLRGLDVYLGDGHYITLANLFSGRTGRILLREFLGIDPQSSLLERLVEASTPVRFRRSPSTLKPDFYIDTLEPQRSSQSQSEACVLRHRFVDLSLKLTPAQLAFTLGGKDVLPEKSRRRSLSRGLRALAIM